jgi:hypothetical protein
MSDPQNDINSNNYDDHVGNERNHGTATNTSAGMTNDAGNRNTSSKKQPPPLGHRLHDGRLPNGQLINYKNTMQSYDHLVTQPQPQQLPPFSSGRGADGVFGGDADDIPNVNTFQFDNANRNNIHNVPSSTI